VKHTAARSFWAKYHALPLDVRTRADRCFHLLKQMPTHPSLHLKRIGTLWSVRVGRDYRALGRDSNQQIVWFWIGSHADYDKLVSGTGSDSLRETVGIWSTSSSATA
jgi:hypothetical protein